LFLLIQWRDWIASFRLLPSLYPVTIQIHFVTCAAIRVNLWTSGPRPILYQSVITDITASR
jgi:hypothetical protein